MIPFGPWLPDQPSLGHPGVLELDNAFPGARGSVPSVAKRKSPSPC